MSTELLLAVVGAVSAILGSSVGGVISYFASRSTKVLEWKHELAERELRNKEELYADFLAELMRLATWSVDNKGMNLKDLDKASGLLARIELHASGAVTSLARKMISHVLGMHAGQRGKKEKTKEGSFLDLRKEFVSACQDDLNRIKKMPNKPLETTR